MFIEIISVSLFSFMQVDVIVGPFCDLAIAPVARQTKYWNLPIISSGAMDQDFSKQRSTLYPLLTRVGPNDVSLSTFFSHFFHQFGWHRFKLVFSRHGQDNIMNSFCQLVMSALHYTFKELREDIYHDYFKILGSDRSSDRFRTLLREEIGLGYGGKGSMYELRRLWH